MEQPGGIPVASVRIAALFPWRRSIEQACGRALAGLACRFSAFHAYQGKNEIPWLAKF